MVNLKQQKRLAASVAGVGKRKSEFDERKYDITSHPVFHPVNIFQAHFRCLLHLAACIACWIFH